MKTLYSLAVFLMIPSFAVTVTMPGQQVIAAQLRSFRDLDYRTRLSAELAGKTLSIQTAAELVGKKRTQYVKAFVNGNGRGKATVVANENGLFQALFRDHPGAIEALKKLGYIQ